MQEKKREGDVKTMIIEAICSDKDVNCSWHVVASDWQPEENKLHAVLHDCGLVGNNA